MRSFVAAALSLALFYWTQPILAEARQIKVPVDTRVYVALSEELIGKKKFVHEGQHVRARVWRDVVVDDVVVINAGTSVLARVDRLKTAKVAGIRGRLEIGAYETTSTTGKAIQLAGGYMKQGKGRIALSASLAGLVFLPLIFIKGAAAKLPEGTVFDAYVGRDVIVTVETVSALRSINLAGVLTDLRVEVLYDELEKQQKPKYFDFKIYSPVDSPDRFVIDRINGHEVAPITLNVVSRELSADENVTRVNVDIKTLAKLFTKGINRFDVAYLMDGKRVATEIVLNIQF